MPEITVFAFDAAAVRTLMIDGEPWFVAKDIASVLGITWKGSDSTGPLGDLDEDEKGTQIVRTPGGDQRATIINESGMYAFVLKSRKPAAKAFRKWITSEVLPALRREGSYALPGAGQGTAPGPFLTGNPAHAADQLVSADRIFRSILRSSRSAGLPLPRALRRANEVARHRTGIDMLDELDAPDLATANTPALLDPLGVHAFCDAWLAGTLPLPVVPCRSTDLYAAYCHWRAGGGEPAGSLPRVVGAMTRRPDLRHRRARYLDEAGTAMMAGFVLPEHELMPPAGVSQAEWLTVRADEFVQALDGWTDCRA
ncbi:BRO-N domain-containing protein [Thauera butanivorans]|uniref:BRO-N domain-containing protein n=1 Tax=Thauera butanivorans TaxID=86174 RepID=UPI0012FC2C8F|nr:BRO family protein [Thauera butanivorans]